MEPEMKMPKMLKMPTKPKLPHLSRLLLASALLLGACATTGGGGGEAGEGMTATSSFADPLPRSGAATILIAMPTFADFIDVRRGLVAEVQKNFNVSTVPVTKETTAAQLGAAIDRTSPACVVLMNNSTVALFRQYKESLGAKPAPPAVVVMASFLERTRATLPKSTGIAYEVPGVTAFRSLRAVILAPVRKVGVVYRPGFKEYIDKQKELAATEQIELVAVEVAKDISASDLKDVIVALAPKVDALWMLNDNGLIRDGRFLDDSWRAALQKVTTEQNLKLPLIVGLPNLVDPVSPLGTIAVVPDHETLGLQTANLIFDVADDGWKVEDHAIELPLSVKTVVDVKQARDRFGLQPDALHHIDRAIE
jgi:putative ABC transport system substrate-binding protein